jgi:glycosyltransferase involved in cell wall biosynthesis
LQIILLLSGITGIALSIGYFFLIRFFLKAWRALPVWQSPDGFIPKAGISVIIPARNEAGSLAACLRSVLSQRYPAGLYEIIVVDDHSTDMTPEIAQSFEAEGIRLLKLADHIHPDQAYSFKKKAIETGIAHARGELIVTTDADCEVPPGWLRLIASVYETCQAAFIAAPVNFHKEKNLLQRFQSLDFLGMMLLTGAGYQSGWMRMANGANLAFPRKIFLEVGGYKGADRQASGDDMFLAHKISLCYPERMFFLKNVDAAIRTEAPGDLRSFFNQRLRWATKNKGLGNRSMVAILALVFLLCWGIILNLLLTPAWGWPAGVFLVQLSIKIFADYMLLREATHFFNRRDLLKSFWPSQGLHILYIAVIGLLANLIRRYEWKGRRVE